MFPLACRYYEAYRLFGEALEATGANITYSICPFIAGCDKSIWNYYADVAHMSMNQCPEHDATDSWTSFLWHVDDSSRNGVGVRALSGRSPPCSLVFADLTRVSAR